MVGLSFESNSIAERGSAKQKAYILTGFEVVGGWSSMDCRCSTSSSFEMEVVFFLAGVTSPN